MVSSTRGHVKAGVNIAAWGRKFYHNSNQSEQLQALCQSQSWKKIQTNKKQETPSHFFRVTHFLINV